MGASGFIGRNLAGALAQTGADLHVVLRRPAEGLPGTPHSADLLAPGAASDLIQSLKPDVVFSLAGYGIDRTQTGEIPARRINQELPEEVARACSQLPELWKGMTLVHVGSALEYGSATGDLDESSHPLPTTLYGHTKLAGTLAVEAVARVTGLRCVTARLFTVYGPWEKEGRLLPSLIQTAHSGGRLPLTEGSQQRDFTFVGDVVEGLLRLGACQLPVTPIVNLATGTLQTVRQFVLEAAELLDLRPHQLAFGEVPMRPEEMSHLPVAIHRLRRLLGWVPQTTVADGIRQTIALGAFL